MSYARWKAVCSLAFAAFTAACGDLPVGSEREPREQARSVKNVAMVGQNAEFVCFTSVRTLSTANRYRHGALVLHFPETSRARDGALQYYQIRWQTEAGEILRAANCRIPRTPQAVAIMERRLLGDDRRRMLRQAGPVRFDGGGCTNGTCALPPLIVIAPGSGLGGGGGGGGGGGCGWNASAGDCYYEPGEADEWDPGPDGTYRPACERDAKGDCITRQVDPVKEWPALLARIDRIREDSVYCKGAKEGLQYLASLGPESQRIRFWDGYDTPTPTSQLFGNNLSDAQGRYIEYDSFWIWNDKTLLVHEGIHYWLSLNPDNEGLVNRPDGLTNEEWIRSIAGNCV